MPGEPEGPTFERFSQEAVFGTKCDGRVRLSAFKNLSPFSLRKKQQEPGRNEENSQWKQLEITEWVRGMT